MTKIMFWVIGLVLSLVLPAAEPDEKKEREKEEPLKEYVVVTATAVKESAKDVVGSFSLVPRETIERWKLVNLSELLDFSGAELSLASGTYGQMSSNLVRGASSAQTLFLINNVRINDPAALSLDVSLISPQVFGQAEVIDGPQSSLYGSEAMGGVVNLVPGERPGLHASLWGGAASSLGTLASWGRKIGRGASLELRYSHFRTEGTEENSDFLTHNAFGELALEGEKWQSKPFLFYAQAATGIPFNLGNPSPWRRNRTAMLVAGVPLQLHINQKLAADFTLGYSGRDYALTDPQDAWSSRYHTNSRSYQAQARMVYDWLGPDSPLIVGGELTGGWVDEESSSGSTFENRGVHASAFWLEQIVKRGGVRGVLSLRYDRYSGFSPHASPRLSLGYDRTFGRLLLGVYAMGSGGFRAPKLTEYASPWGNPDLSPERSFCLEGGMTAALGSFSLRAGYFSTRFQDMIVYDFASNRLVNSGRDRIEGWQLQPAFSGRHVSISCAFLRLRTVNLESGEPLLRRPGQMLKVTLQGEWGKVYAAVLGRFVGPRSDLDERTYLPVTAEAFSVFSLTAGWRISRHATLFVKVQNVLDRTYMEIYGYQAPGRMAYAGFDFNL